MKSIFVAIIILVSSQIYSRTKPLTTLNGLIMCNLCKLQKGSKCQNVIVVPNKTYGKPYTIYYLDDKVYNEWYHKEICGGGSKWGTVIGVVSEDTNPKRYIIKPVKVEFKKGLLGD